MSVGLLRRALTGLAAAATTSVVRGALDWQPPGGPARWTRRNHAGEPVSLLEGPAVTVGVLTGALSGATTAQGGLAAAVAVLGAGGFGLLDDLGEGGAEPTKGLRGHLGALARGRLTTGGLKVLGIGASAVLAAALLPRVGPRGRRTADVLVDAAIIAGTANLVNLLDLRPGRALKAAAAVAGPVALAAGPGAVPASAVLGAAVAASEQDLAETDMLGDCGANALGAALGTAIAQSGPRAVRIAWLVTVGALTVVSERVSFTAVIERTPALAAVDAWGRRRRPGRG
ncbi:hypothetical protein [Cellulomonas sp. SG140]|uniref:hypothetical protein n=1 Tax=Cellulomonas sp. SG140 TaxID=2976536 RepID=UPI0021E9AE36|nr:hypothetical protein [Cellulomonas sp. SG140]